MALRTLSLTGTIPCLTFWQIPTLGGAVSPMDVAAIGAAMVDDSDIGSILGGNSFGPQAVQATGTLNGTTLITSIVLRGATTVPLSQIQIGDVILGVGVRPGSFVQNVSGGGTQVTMSAQATASASGVALLFVRQGYEQSLAEITPFGQLFIPSRGTLKVLPGDIVAVDNAGNAILIFGRNITYGGSQWNLV